MAGYGKRIPGGEARSGVKEYWKKICFFTVLWFGSFWYLGGITAKAEPVSLQSASAVIYAGTDEAGDKVGNLVRGGSFELLGTVTAEDGSSWYHVSAFGREGYIKGDAEIERGQAEGPTPEDNVIQEGAGETTQTGNEEPAQPGVAETLQPGNGEPAQGNAESQNGTSAPERDNGQTEGEAPPDTEETMPGEAGEETENPEEYEAAYGGVNTRKKTYAGSKNSLKNIDVQDISKDEMANAADVKPATEPTGKINIITLFFSVVSVGTVWMVLISFCKLRRMSRQSETGGSGFRESGKKLGNEKTIHKKKKRRKKKGKSKKNGNTKKQQF